MNLHDYLRVLRRDWWVLPIFLLLGAAAAGALSLRTPPLYQSTASSLVVTPSSSITTMQLGNQLALARVSTYAGLASTAAVLDRAAAGLGSGSSGRDLSKSVSASVQAGTAIVQITASADSPNLAAARANAVAVALNLQVQALDGGSGGDAAPISLQVVQAAQPNTDNVNASPVRNAVLGAGAGLALGIIIIIIIEALDTRIRSPRDLATILGRRPAAIVPERRRLGTPPSGKDERREAFRTLRASLRPGTTQLRSIAITAAGAKGSVADVAGEFARAIAETGLRVVVVDVDLRPEQIRGRGPRSDGSPIAGLADVLEERALLADVLVAGTPSNMATLSAGAPSSRSAQLLSTDAMRETLLQLTHSFDAVLLACPPLLTRSDSSIVASITDATLMVVDARHTSRSDAVFALEMLERVGVTQPAVVLRDVRRGDMVLPSGVIATA